MMIAALVVCAPLAAQDWRVHEMTRPHPATAPAVPVASADRPPPGADVLFNGTDLARWRISDSLAARWIVWKGYFEARPGTGTLTTVDPVLVAATGEDVVAPVAEDRVLAEVAVDGVGAGPPGDGVVVRTAVHVLEAGQLP